MDQYLLYMENYFLGILRLCGEQFTTREDNAKIYENTYIININILL